VGRADVYLQPLAGDPVLPDRVVLELVRRHVPKAGAVSGVDESGGEARVYFVDDGLVLKTQRPHRLRPRTSLAKEAHLLQTLADRLGERIPGLLGYGQGDTGEGPVEYVCMTRLPGSAAGQVAIVDRPGVLADVGRLLRDLHATPAEDAVVPRDEGWAALRVRLESGFGDVIDALAAHPHRWRLPFGAEEVVSRALGAVPDGDGWRPVVLHSNPGPTHVFVDPATHRFTGVIDFGDSYLSHPALDLHRWPAPADRVLLREAYLHGADAGGDFDRVWTIAMIQTDLAVIATGSPHTDAAAADLSLRLGRL
jgi:aminoglycoside phosphotransferase (APT) family kinase protein